MFCGTGGAEVVTANVPRWKWFWRKAIINEEDKQGRYLSWPGPAHPSAACAHPFLYMPSGDVSLPGSSVPLERTKTNELEEVHLWNGLCARGRCPWGCRILENPPGRCSRAGMGLSSRCHPRAHGVACAHRGGQDCCSSTRNANMGQSASAAAKWDVMKSNQLITLRSTGRIADERAFK